MKSLLTNGFVFGGLLLIAAGTAGYSRPAAFIVVGVGLLGLGLLGMRRL